MSNSSKATRPTVRVVPEALRDSASRPTATLVNPAARKAQHKTQAEPGRIEPFLPEEALEPTTCFRREAVRIMQPAVSLPQRLYVACGIQAVWSRSLTAAGLQADPEIWSADDPVNARPTPVFASEVPRPSDCYRAALGRHYDHDQLLLTELDLCDSTRNRASARLYRREGDRIRLVGRCEAVGELHRFLEWIAAVPEFVQAALGRNRPTPAWHELLGTTDVIEAWATLAQDGRDLLGRVGLDAQPVHLTVASRWSTGTYPRIDHAA